VPHCCAIPSAKEEKLCCEEDLVKVFRNGTCQWIREFRRSISHCSIDVTWFPFDHQVCDLIYESKNYKVDQLNLTATSPAVGLSSYSTHGLWKLRGKSFTTLNTKYFTRLRSRFLHEMTTACVICILHCLLEQESRAVARIPRDAAAVVFGLKFADNIL